MKWKLINISIYFLAFGLSFAYSYSKETKEWEKVLEEDKELSEKCRERIAEYGCNVNPSNKVDEPTEEPSEHLVNKSSLDELYSKKVDTSVTDYSGYRSKIDKMVSEAKEKLLASMEHPEDEEPEDVIEEVPDILEQASSSDNENEETSFSTPRIISSDEYGEMATFDTSSLVYYMGDGVLATEDEYEVEDINYIIGDSLTSDGFIGDDSRSLLYVRNYKTRTDYEIIKVNSHYGDGVWN